MSKIGDIEVLQFARNMWQTKSKGMSHSYIVHIGWENTIHNVPRCSVKWTKKFNQRDPQAYYKLMSESLYTNSSLAEKFLTEGGKYYEWFTSRVDPEIKRITGIMHRKIEDRISADGRRAIQLYKMSIANAKRDLKNKVKRGRILPLNIEFAQMLESEGQFGRARIFMNPFEGGATVYNIVQHYAIEARDKIEECILAGAYPDIANSTKRARKSRGNPESPPLNETGTFARAVKYEIVKVKD